MPDHAPITAIVTAFRRVEQTLKTLRQLESCDPSPDEILVHVDGNESECATAIRASYPRIAVITSETRVGPGGGRNKLVAKARNELIASFDDDSYPFDTSFFARTLVLGEAYPDASLIAASIFHDGEKLPRDEKVATRTASFGSGGVVFRRSEFIAAGGFVPLVVAYGMEEEDLALRLFNRGGTLIYSPWLRVFHDSDLAHHRLPHVNSAAIANLALLAWLRYPARYWPYGAAQVLNRVLWCVRAGRWAGVTTGLARAPAQVARYWRLRNPVSGEAMRLRFAARQHEFMAFVPHRIDMSDSSFPRDHST